jgi:hypothetical protein
VLAESEFGIRESCRCTWSKPSEALSRKTVKARMKPSSSARDLKRTATQSIRWSPMSFTSALITGESLPITQEWSFAQRTARKKAQINQTVRLPDNPPAALSVHLLENRAITDAAAVSMSKADPNTNTCWETGPPCGEVIPGRANPATTTRTTGLMPLQDGMRADMCHSAKYLSNSLGLRRDGTSKLFR